MNGDDERTLDGLREAAFAIENALEALRKAVEGHGRQPREQLAFSVSFALGRLQRVAERLDMEAEK